MGKLDLDDVVFAVLQAEGETIEGRTRLQKMCYFVSYLLREEMSVDPAFSAHYYGPYSSAVSSTVDSEVGRGLVDETTRVFPWGAFVGHDMPQRRYSYRLTPRGKEALEWRRRQAPDLYRRATGIATSIRDTGADYAVLSYAAKAHFVLRQEGNPITRAAIRERASTLGWPLEPEQLELGVKLLKDLDLVTEQEED